jgi:hypothetical protein
MNSEVKPGLGTSACTFQADSATQRKATNKVLIEFMIEPQKLIITFDEALCRKIHTMPTTTRDIGRIGLA